jgi:hypothetical protein
MTAGAAANGHFYSIFKRKDYFGYLNSGHFISYLYDAARCASS